MQLVALLSDSAPLAKTLASYRHPEFDIRLHPVIRPLNLAATLSALEALQFAGALVIDASYQQTVFGQLQDHAFGAKEAGVTDSITVTPGRMIGDYSFGRAVTAVLRDANWDGRNASAVVMGSGAKANAICRELSSFGVEHLTLIADNKPLAEQSTGSLAATTTLVTRASADPVASTLIQQADLLVRVNPALQVDYSLLGPHLTIVDMEQHAMSELRVQAMNLGAYTFGYHDVTAYQLSLALGTILGTRIEPEAFMTLLHSI